jgi:hypothetical protein
MFELSKGASVDQRYFKPTKKIRHLVLPAALLIFVSFDVALHHLRHNLDALIISEDDSIVEFQNS